MLSLEARQPMTIFGVGFATMAISAMTLLASPPLSNESYSVMVTFRSVSLPFAS